MERRISATNPDFYYFVSGKNPRLLIHTGTHGDEWEIIDLVKKALEKYELHLPAFVFFPEVSPSAVAAKTRANARGKDINRIFYSDSDDPEVIENIKHLSGKHFDLFISFHEDVGIEEYYIYNTGKIDGKNKAVVRHNGKLKAGGIKLLNGLDDTNDPALGYEFKGGYRRFVFDGNEPDNGMITVWLMNRGMVNEYMIPEIPGRLDIKKKEFIIDSFFRDVLLRLA